MTLCKGFALTEGAAHNPSNDMCHSDVLAEGSYEKIPQQVRDDKYVSEAHSKELNVLTSYRLNDFKKKAGATHVDMSANIRRAAFTLAEVLITLAIIGVVAAMTIPTLISNYKKKDTSAKLKKFYSMMSQAIQLSEIENGPAEHWQKTPMIWKPDGTADHDTNKKLAEQFINKYILPYIKYSKVTDSEKQQSDDGVAMLKKIYLNDGTTIDVKNSGSIELFYDTNGKAKPNTTGKDIFYFNLATPVSERERIYGNKNQILGPYTYINNDKLDNYTLYDTREKALQKCKEHVQTCTNLLLKYDNFEFKEDYPWL